MGYTLEFNCLLVVPRESLDLTKLEVGGTHHLVKEDERIYPLNIAIEICDADYKYYGKVAVRKLTLEKGQTTIEIEVLKVFDEVEREVYTRTFIKP